MKFTFGVVILACVVGVLGVFGSPYFNSAASKVVKLQRFEKYRKDVKPIWDKCALTYGVTQPERDRLINYQYGNPTEGMILIVNCYLNTVGTFTNGELQQLRAWELYSWMFDEVQLATVLNQCKNAGGYEPYDRGYRFFECFETVRTKLDAQAAAAEKNYY